MSAQLPEEQKKKKRNNQEEGDTFAEGVLDTLDELGCFRLLLLPFRIVFSVVKAIFSIFD